MNIFRVARATASYVIKTRSLEYQPIWNVIRPSLSKTSAPIPRLFRQYSSLVKITTNDSISNQKWSTRVLLPVIPTTNTVPPKAGMKLVNNPKRRCKHCYIVIEDERKFVFCDKYPRHKQATKRPGPIIKVSRIMTHATQGGQCRGNGRGRMAMWTQQGLREDY